MNLLKLVPMLLICLAVESTKFDSSGMDEQLMKDAYDCFKRVLCEEWKSVDFYRAVEVARCPGESLLEDVKEIALWAFNEKIEYTEKYFAGISDIVCNWSEVQQKDSVSKYGARIGAVYQEKLCQEMESEYCECIYRAVEVFMDILDEYRDKGICEYEQSLREKYDNMKTPEKVKNPTPSQLRNPLG